MNIGDEAKLERAVKLRAEMVDLLLEVSTSSDTMNLRRVHALKYIARIDKAIFAAFCIVSIALLVSPWFGSTASWIAVFSWFCLLTGGVVAIFFRSVIDKLTD